MQLTVFIRQDSFLFYKIDATTVNTRMYSLDNFDLITFITLGCNFRIEGGGGGNAKISLLQKRLVKKKTNLKNLKFKTYHYYYFPEKIYTLTETYSKMFDQSFYINFWINIHL